MSGTSEKREPEFRECKECGKLFARGTGRGRLCPACNRKYVNGILKRMYEKNKEQGICVTCRQRPALPGYIQCGLCIRKKKAYEAARAARREAEQNG